MSAARPTPRRLSRTFTRARWPEYAQLLDRAIARDYAIVHLDRFLADGPPAPRTLVLRHDVDQAPASVAPMLAAERERGLAGTWYFRWRTARPDVVESVLEAGGTVGLHYETLTRQVLTRRAADLPDDVEALIEPCRTLLRAELRAFTSRFGPTASAAAHGDTRAAGVSNADLLRDQDPAPYGLRFDANAGMLRHDLACWLTDRSRPDGSWKDGLDPLALLDEGASPILCLTHPNNWTSGLRLWSARLRHGLGREGDRPPLPV